ncbi:hypothetical protein AX15_002282 [Amanita polypyramis BW_CC]|nr:hypothetical protein AX15_002282 [Amanita polypyramis BW_CC]
MYETRFYLEIERAVCLMCMWSASARTIAPEALKQQYQIQVSMMDADPLTLLRTQNYDALDMIVEDIVARHEKDIARINAEIERFQCCVRQLHFQKLQHEELVRRCKGMTTVARRLPPEVLAFIFEMCVNDGWTLTPLLASHLCSEWRKAASSPHVWSHVYVNCDATRDPYSKTKLWLDKAQDSFLRVTVEARTDGTHLSRVMTLLTARSYQWRSLSITCSSHLHLMQLLSSCKRPSPSLWSIHISVEHGLDALDGSDILTTVPLGTAFPEAPHLQLFVFVVIYFPPRVSFHPL